MFMQFILSYSVFFVNAFRTGDRDFAAVGRSETELLKDAREKEKYIRSENRLTEQSPKPIFLRFISLGM